MPMMASLTLCRSTIFRTTANMASRLWIPRLQVGFMQKKCLHVIQGPDVYLRDRGTSILSSLSSRHTPFRMCSSNNLNEVLDIHPKVASALRNGDAVVAMESTIITHGMPYPHNLRTALYLGDIIRSRGDVEPATIAALQGKLCVGLTREQFETLANSSGEAVKTSRRDLAWVLSQKHTGGTTVSGTMVAAHLAGISIFITGGIGGVHRGGETTLDISADLTELGRTPVTVVSAGVKSILDIPRTLEYLETQGVTVATFGSSPEFPSFFSRHSGVKSPMRVQTAKEAAELILCNQTLKLGSGILIAVPIPEEFAADGDAIETAIQNAVVEATDRGISGNEVTPFILQRVNELTEGKSLEANKALIANNARVGASIAAELARIKRGRRAPASPPPDEDEEESGSTSVGGRSQHERRFSSGARSNRPVVVGSCIVDHTAMVLGAELQYGGPTNVGRFHVTYGGVGRNIADTLTRLGANPIFLSAIGTDFGGKALQSNCSHMDFSKVLWQDNLNTATYCVMLGKTGEVELAVGDMEINDTITPDYLSQHAMELRQAPLVVMDGNIPVESIEYISSLCREHRTPLWFEPACVMKGVKACQSDAWRKLTFASPNLSELKDMCEAIRVKGAMKFGDDQSFQNKLQEYLKPYDLMLAAKLRECLELCRVMLTSVHCLVITLGEEGVLVCLRGDPQHPLIGGTALQHHLDERSGAKPSNAEIHGQPSFSAIHYPACSLAKSEIVSVSGAGDCLAATVMASMLLDRSPDECFHAGLLAARLSLLSHHAVPDSVSKDLLSPSPCDHLIPEPNHIGWL